MSPITAEEHVKPRTEDIDGLDDETTGRGRNRAPDSERDGVPLEGDDRPWQRLLQAGDAEAEQATRRCADHEAHDLMGKQARSERREDHGSEKEVRRSMAHGRACRLLGVALE